MSAVELSTACGQTRCSVILAMDRHGVIGKGGKLPWHLPADLKRFKQLTMGHHIIMGRKTFESIGRALPGRTNIVVTHQKDFHALGCVLAHSLSEAMSVALTAGDKEPFIIGGANLCVEALGQASRLYLTHIETEVQDGDVYFPPLDMNQWKVVSEVRCAPDEKNQYTYRFVDYQRQ